MSMFFSFGGTLGSKEAPFLVFSAHCKTSEPSEAPRLRSKRLQRRVSVDFVPLEGFHLEVQIEKFGDLGHL